MSYELSEFRRLEARHVALVTEEEFVSRSGRPAGTGKPNQLAQGFAEGFTANYEAIAAERPIYWELEGLFRHLAVARIFRRKTDGAGLEYLLESFPVREILVPRTLPGISNFKDFQHRWAAADGYREVRLRLPSCGGVAVNVEPKPVAGSNDAARDLVARRKEVLSRRPSSQALSWSAEASS